MRFVFSRRQTQHFCQAGVDMWVYSDKNVCSQANILYQEVNGRHNQEFLHQKSAHIYYIIEGKGEFIINGQPYSVQATDVIIIPPKTKFYYQGKMKQILVVAPAWDPRYEQIIRQL